LHHPQQHPEQAAVKQELIAALTSEPVRSVVLAIGDAVAEIGAEAFDRQAAAQTAGDAAGAAAAGWPELLPTLLQLAGGAATTNPACVEAALAVVADLADPAIGQLAPHLGSLHALINRALSGGGAEGAATPAASGDVQAAALRAMVNVVAALSEDEGGTASGLSTAQRKEARDSFQALVPQALAALGRALSAGDEDVAQELLELFVALADAEPRFLRKHLPEAVDAMLAVASADQLEPATRSLAAEFAVTLAEARDKAPGMVRRLPNFAGRLFEALMGFLLDVEDDKLWHAAESAGAADGSAQHEDEGHGELFDGGQEYLDRAAIALGGKALLPAAGALLPAWLGDAQDWRKRHAALICLAQIAEGCERQMREQLEPLVAMCLAGLRDPHPKVRWAACQALGQMCTDLGPDLQEAAGDRVLPALIAAMEDFDHPRVQAHASAVVVNFSEGADPTKMAPHLDALLSQLIALLRNGKRLVQEGALTAMASVADASQSQFDKYYAHVMPLLSAVLTQAAGREHRLLRAKALECVSLVGMAVGRERFRADAGAVMAYLSQLHSSELEADDPTQGYMLQAGARLCKALGAEFVPYLSVVMPPLLRAAAQEPDVRVDDANDENGLDEDGDEDEDVERIPFGDKVLTIRTSVLEEKATACAMLCCYLDELKEGFLPYVQPVADLMLPLLRFYFHEEVRRSAVHCLPQLLSAACRAVAAGAPGADPALPPRLLAAFWPALVAALSKEPDADIQSQMLESLAEMVELTGEPGAGAGAAGGAASGAAGGATGGAGVLSEAEVGAAFAAISQAFDSAEARRRQRQTRQQAEDFDEEELEALQQENEAEEDLFDNVSTAVGAFLKKFGDAVLPLVETLMPKIAPLLDRSRPDEERRIAMCIVDDLLEHSPAGREKYAAQVLPVMLDALLSAHGDLRQCSAYGVGVSARLAPAALAPHAALAAQRLLAVVSHGEARNSDNEMASDNAAAALGALLEGCGGGGAAAGNGAAGAGALALPADAAAAVAEAWVRYLPLRADAIEAQREHERLARLLEVSFFFRARERSASERSARASAAAAAAARSKD
jgi:hypothetical protein